MPFHVRTFWETILRMTESLLVHEALRGVGVLILINPFAQTTMAQGWFSKEAFALMEVAAHLISRPD